MSDPPLHLVGLAGSLRDRSFNRALLSAAGDLAPEGLRVEPFDLAGVPLYNADLDTDERRPEAVVRLKAAIAAADGVLVVTPEYNGGVPGVLKNALDWASRPAFRSPMAHKPVGLMGAATGSGGTIRAQEQLRLVLLSMIAHVFPHRSVLVARARDTFDDDLRLIDDKTRRIVQTYLTDFEAWIRRVRQA